MFTNVSVEKLKWKFYVLAKKKAPKATFSPQKSSKKSPKKTKKWQK